MSWRNDLRSLADQIVTYGKKSDNKGLINIGNRMRFLADSDKSDTSDIRSAKAELWSLADFSKDLSRQTKRWIERLDAIIAELERESEAIQASLDNSASADEAPLYEDDGGDGDTDSTGPGVEPA